MNLLLLFHLLTINCYYSDGSHPRLLPPSAAQVISHLAVQRCLYAYFTGTPMEDFQRIDESPHGTAST